MGNEDCIYYIIYACDGGRQCENCTKQIAYGEPGYDIIYNAYNEDIDAAIAPIKEKWKKLFLEGTIC